MSDEPAGKWCPYCGLPHSRRARACSDYCERKIRSWKQSCTAGRNRVIRKVMAGQQKAAQHKQRWRNVAMGRDAKANLLAIFDVERLPK